jgi:capsular exopolysaccharide synthesis family protein
LEYLPPKDGTQTEEEWNPSQLFGFIRRRLWVILGVTAATTAAATGLSLNQASTYQGQFQMLVEPVTSQSQKDRAPLSDAPKSEKDGGFDYETQIQVLLSPKTLEPIAEQIQQKYPNISSGTLAGRLLVERPGETKLLGVKYTDTDPDRIKFVLDKLAEGYLQYSQRERESNLKAGLRFVDSQIAETRQRVDSLQRQLQNFRQQNNLMQPDAVAGQVQEQMKNLSQQQFDVQKQLAETQRQMSLLQDRSGAVAALGSDPAYQAALNRMREIESKIAVESTRFQDDNAEMRALRQQRDSLIPVLQQEARRVLGNKLSQAGTDLSVLSARQQALGRAQSFWNREMQRMPIVARAFTDLEREQKVATDSLNRLLETRENLQVQSAQNEIPWQVITPPQRPGSPKDPPMRTVLLGAIAGLLLGMGAASLSDRLDERLRTVSDLKKQTKLPILAAIPHDSSAVRQGKFTWQNLPSQHSDYSGFLEAFRSFYANLCLLKPNQPIRSLVISSAAAEDGRSTIAIHLAYAAAVMGQRVLLVDGDLRSPHLGELLELDSKRGLTDLIVQSLNPQDLIQPIANSALSPKETTTTIERVNLSVLASGELQLDPMRMLSSDKLHRLTEYFKAIYDLVIFDTSPLLNFADATLLASHADGMVIVAGMNKTNRSELKQMLDNLETARVSVLGVIANDCT